MTSFAVLMDVSRREVGPMRGSCGTVGGSPCARLGAQGFLPPTLQNGEILPLKTLTYVALGVTLAALLFTFLFLTLLRTLRSNQHGIRRNLTAALGLAQLVFLLGINQADLPVRWLSTPETSPPSTPSGSLVIHPNHPSSSMSIPAPEADLMIHCRPVPVSGSSSLVSPECPRS